MPHDSEYAVPALPADAPKGGDPFARGMDHATKHFRQTIENDVLPLLLNAIQQDVDPDLCRRMKAFVLKHTRDAVSTQPVTVPNGPHGAVPTGIVELRLNAPFPLLIKVQDGSTRVGSFPLQAHHPIRINAKYTWKAHLL